MILVKKDSEAGIDKGAEGLFWHSEAPDELARTTGTSEMVACPSRQRNHSTGNIVEFQQAKKKNLHGHANKPAYTKHTNTPIYHHILLIKERKKRIYGTAMLQIIIGYQHLEFQSLLVKAKCSWFLISPRLSPRPASATTQIPEQIVVAASAADSVNKVTPCLSHIISSKMFYQKFTAFSMTCRSCNYTAHFSVSRKWPQAESKRTAFLRADWHVPADGWDIVNHIFC